MKRLLLITWVIVLCHLSSLNGQSKKEIKYIKSCKPALSTFYEKIPIEYFDGLLVIEVSIDNKKYNFLLDTGAPSSIDKSIAEDLGLKTLYTSTVTDASMIKQEVDYTVVPEVFIGSLGYHNMFSIIDDFTE